MSVFRNVMVYLGLGADEEFDDDYLADDSRPGPSAGRDSDPARGPIAVPAGSEGVAPGRPAAPRGSFGNGSTRTPSAVGEVRPLRAVPSEAANRSGSDPQGRDEAPTRMTVRVDDSAVRPLSIQRTKPRTLTPQSFGDAKVLADELRKSVPVVMNLRSLDRDLARRLIDFASGSCYSLGGKMEKIAPQVFLLIPKSVEVSDDDRRRIDERGFDRE